MEPSAPTAIPGDYQYRANYLGPVYQRFHHHQRRLLIERLLPIGPGDRVLDAGCGSGVFAEYMHRKGARVWGVDTNEQAVAFAQDTFSRPGLTFWCQPIHDVKLPDSSVDKILLGEVVEHLTTAYLERVAQEFRRVLAPRGLLLVTAPNYRSAWPVLEYLLDALKVVASLHEQHVTRTSVTYFRRCPFNEFATLKAAGCFNYLSSVLAVASWRLAESIARLELRLPFPGGFQVYGLWEKTT